VKLPLRERGHEALTRELVQWEGVASSALLRVEAERACARYGARFVPRVHASLARTLLVPLDAAVLDAAAALEPPALRSLDAIHLATALSLGTDLAVMYVYDERLASAARDAGVKVEAPA
jgi:predicted nucleic acid-binding protein